MKFRAVILLVFVCFSCKKELPYVQDKSIPDLPVIHAFICPDSVIQLSCRTLAGLLDDDQPISQAVFTLTRNGIFDGATTYSGLGIHRFATSSFKPGDSFDFEGLIGSSKRITVPGKIPNSIVIAAADTSRRPTAGVGMVFSVNLSFTDSARYANYYRVYFLKTELKYKFDASGKLIDSMLIREIIPIYGVDLPVIQNNYNNYTVREVLFSDATFNGVNQKMLFYTTDKLLKTRQQRPLSLDIYIESLDKPLFAFYNTRNAHLWQQQSISQIPGVVQGNINGALGVVGAYTIARTRIQFK